jgi:hypothetical protein
MLFLAINGMLHGGVVLEVGLETKMTLRWR